MIERSKMHESKKENKRTWHEEKNCDILKNSTELEIFKSH